MKALKELMSIITRNKRRHVKVLGYHENATDNYERFYDGMEKAAFKNDDQAAAHFYGKGFDGKSTQYVNLKNKFKKRLLNTLFFIDLKQPEYNDAQQAFQTCWRNMTSVKILQARGLPHAARELAEKTLPKAIQFDLTEIILELSRMLAHFYCTYKGDQKKWAYYDGIVKQQLEIMTIITKTESYYQELIIPYVKSRTSKPWISEKARLYLSELKPYLDKFQPYRFVFLYYTIAKIERASVHDYAGTVSICKEAIEKIQALASFRPSSIALFSHTIVISLTMLGEYEEAEAVAIGVEKLVDEGTTNWFKGREQHLVLKFHKKDYAGAKEIFRQAIHHPRLPLLPSTEQESWKLYGAYMHLFALAGRVRIEEGEFPDFRLSKFLNEVPEHSRDKRGMNIAVQLVHVLTLLLQEQHDQSWDRLLALEKYALRNLKDSEDGHRAWCFLQALLQLQKAGFQRKETEERAAEWLEEMRRTPARSADSPHESETVPFPLLWEVAMEGLERAAGGAGIDIDLEIVG